MTILSFIKKCKTLVGKSKWDNNKIFICKDSSKKAVVVLPDGKGLFVRSYYCEEWETPVAAALISHFFETGNIDSGIFYEIYGWEKEIPEEFNCIWRLNSHGHEEMSKWINRVRKDHREVGFREVPRPKNGFKEVSDYMK